MHSSSPEIHDVIIVGAGPAGTTLASRLARSAAHPSILLIEAGGLNDSKSVTIDAERWLHRFNPDQNWGYQSVPQDHLDGSVVALDCGKGIGGSSSINFSLWTWGPRDDFEEMARLVGDEEWDWEHASRQLKKLESYDGIISEGPAGVNYLNPSAKDHGNHGPVKVGFPKIWEKSSQVVADIWTASGYSLNPDLNSGNPLGLSLSPSTVHRGARTTSSSLLLNAPSNLHILTNVNVARVLFSHDDPLEAIGIETSEGVKFLARAEVILSAGALSTPKLLLLAGIGPASELEKHSIPVRLNLPAVGRGLKDHHHITPTWIRAPHTTDRHTFYQSPSLQAAARAQWDTDGTGPLSEISCIHTTGFFKSDAIYQSDEFKALPEERQRHLSQPTVPLYEVFLNGPSAEQLISPSTAQPLVTIFIFVLNAEYPGTVTLSSSDPVDAPLCDPEYFSDPFGRRVAIEATREAMAVTESAEFKKDTVELLHGPKSTSEEDILAYWRERTCSTWHMCGTVRMGREGEERAGVDREFRVLGTKGLRVVDLSVMPILPNAHTQAMAYLTGAIAGDKIVKEYGWDDIA